MLAVLPHPCLICLSCGRMPTMQTPLLQPLEFDAHVRNGTLRLALVGMSNAGKSYRSRMLRDELNFFWYEVDVHIQKILELDGMPRVNEWLGQPTSPGYKKRQAKYLEAEEQSTHLHELDTGGQNLVFDTTGSVIYLSEVVKTWLRHECLIVNIDVGEETIPAMKRKYFEEPKPVIWGSYFSQQSGETEEQALRRSYPQMLRARLQAYRQLAHLTIPFAELYGASGEQTLSVIKNHLSSL